MSNDLVSQLGMNQRKFVRNSAAAAAGSMLVGQLSVEASAYVRGNETIKVAVIGCGGRGTGAADQALSVSQDVKLVAMVDAFQNRLDESYENLKKKHGDSGRLAVPDENKFVGFEGYKEAIALADVVLLATPPGFRPIHFEEAVNAGKHVFMEKPVAVDAPGVRKVLEMAEKSQREKAQRGGRPATPLSAQLPGADEAPARRRDRRHHQRTGLLEQ